MLTNTLEAWELAKARRKEEDKRRAAEDAKRKEAGDVKAAKKAKVEAPVARETSKAAKAIGSTTAPAPGAGDDIDELKARRDAKRSSK